MGKREGTRRCEPERVKFGIIWHLTGNEYERVELFPTENGGFLDLVSSLGMNGPLLRTVRSFLVAS